MFAGLNELFIPCVCPVWQYDVTVHMHVRTCSDDKTMNYDPYGCSAMYITVTSCIYHLEMLGFRVLSED